MKTKILPGLKTVILIVSLFVLQSCSSSINDDSDGFPWGRVLIIATIVEFAGLGLTSYVENKRLRRKLFDFEKWNDQQREFNTQEELSSLEKNHNDDDLKVLESQIQSIKKEEKMMHDELYELVKNLPQEMRQNILARYKNLLEGSFFFKTVGMTPTYEKLVRGYFEGLRRIVERSKMRPEHKKQFLTKLY